jgi:valyl-tRNA synthetase
VETGQTVFTPRQWENTYFAWMRDIQPWCVSRQLWWGHQIPAWYAPDGEVFVARTEAEAREQARQRFGRDVPLERDPDVLDTWFSSALWPFSTLGWPRETPELKKYYPGDVLVTGFDIIFFWVARMMMMGIYCMGQVPFRTVCIHGLVRDEKGQKMSKSKGNVMDPLELIDAYGADALRFTIAALNGPGRDIKLGRQRVEGYRSFCTKIWNAARFVQMNAAERDAGWLPSAGAAVLSRWLAAKLNSTLREANHALNAFRFDEYARTLYQFTWNTFCDWFIELAKPALTGKDAALRQDVSQAAHFALEQILRALHPVMPFITSEVFERMGYGNALDMPRAAYPTGTETPLFEQDMGVLEVDDAIRLISAVRSARQALNVPLSATPVLRVEAQTSAVHVTEVFGEAIRRLARVERFEVAVEPSVGAGPGASLALGDAKLFMPLGSIIDVDVERRRLNKELEKVKAEGERLAAKLANPSFRAKADEVVISETEGRFGQVQDETQRLTEALRGLG